MVPIANVCHLLNQLWQTGVDLLFPPTCVGCDTVGHHLCPTCAQLVEPLPSTICTSCGRPQTQPTDCCRDCQLSPSSPFYRIRAAALFAPPLNHLVHQFKYEEQPELGYYLSRYLIHAYDKYFWPESVSIPIDAVVPVPLHSSRQAERGYNQAELLARPLALRVGLPLQIDWIHRTKYVRQQVGLSAHERRENVKDAFDAEPQLAGRHLLLVDDVYTTGATLHSCATTALAVGASAVSVLTLAMPIPLGLQRSHKQICHN